MALVNPSKGMGLPSSRVSDPGLDDWAAAAAAARLLAEQYRVTAFVSAFQAAVDRGEWPRCRNCGKEVTEKTQGLARSDGSYLCSPCLRSARSHLAAPR